MNFKAFSANSIPVYRFEATNKEQAKIILSEMITNSKDFLIIEDFPELTKIAQQMCAEICPSINAKAEKTESNMPYKAQYILEELIELLKASV